MATELLHCIKQNDLAPSIRATFFSYDLTGATVLFSMFDLEGNAKITNASAVVVVANPDGIVQYDWVSGDTDTPGTYRAEFQVTKGGIPETFPNSGYIYVQILSELA